MLLFQQVALVGNNVALSYRVPVAVRWKKKEEKRTTIEGSERVNKCVSDDGGPCLRERMGELRFMERYVCVLKWYGVRHGMGGKEYYCYWCDACGRGNVYNFRLSPLLEVPIAEMRYVLEHICLWVDSALASHLHRLCAGDGTGFKTDWSH